MPGRWRKPRARPWLEANHSGSSGTKGNAMKFLLNMSVSKRIAVMLTLLGMLVAGMAVLGASDLTFLRDRFAEAPGRMLTRIALSEWQQLTALNAGRTVAILQSDSATLAEKLAPDMKQTSARISELQKQINTLATNDSQKKLLADVAAVR